jgi:molybdate transport system substrate-binding protein
MSMPLLLRSLGLCAALLLGAPAAQVAQAATVTVSAAASLTQALQQIGPLFEATHPGHTVQFNFGASGALLQQIAKGAPVDAFVSADAETLNQAQVQGLIDAAGRRTIATNALVLIVPASGGKAPATLKDLSQPAYERIAIGVPASVPVGRYTRTALEAAGLWTALEPRLIGAQSVRQALDYVARGEVDAGFVYATDAALMPDKVRVAFTVPTPQPVVYPAAAVRGGPQAALGQRFVDFLLTPAAQAVLARRGFGRP